MWILLSVRDQCGISRRLYAAARVGADGISDFNALHSRQHDEEVQFYAFDILALDGEDLRTLALTRPT